MDLHTKLSNIGRRFKVVALHPTSYHISPKRFVGAIGLAGPDFTWSKEYGCFWGGAELFRENDNLLHDGVYIHTKFIIKWIDPPQSHLVTETRRKKIEYIA